MERLDSVLLEQILRGLPAKALAAAHLASKQWSILISQQQLWQPHALDEGINSKSNAAAPQPLDAAVNWRELSLHRAAALKWRAGQLLLSATLHGHTGPITCLVLLEPSTLLTGSRDCTARLWDLLQGQQQHVLKHADPVVAVALPSVTLCVTATRKAAYLWRQGKAIRSFDVLPGGAITCLALTDTRLLLGSSAGTVQHYDLYSGSQQLITRHGSGVTALLAQQQQQQQHLEPQAREAGFPQQHEDWHVIIGTSDGQVSCIASSTGKTLWQLPTRYPSRVVALSLQHHQLHHHQQQQQQQHQNPKRQSKQKQQPRQQLEQQQLLYVLNGRSQLICWQMPSNSSSSSSQNPCLLLPTCSTCVSQLLHVSRTELSNSTQGSCVAPVQAPAGSAKAAGNRAACALSSTANTAASRKYTSVLLRSRMSSSSSDSRSSSSRLSPRIPTWPLSVCNLPVPTAAAAAGERKSIQTALGLGPVSGYTCLVSPDYGNTCVLVGSSDGFLHVAELVHSSAVLSSAGEQFTSVAAANRAGSSSFSEDNPASSDLSSSSQPSAGDGAASLQAGVPLGEQHQAQQQQQQQQHTAGTGAATPGSSIGIPTAAASVGKPCSTQLQLVKRFLLQRLAKHVAGRAPAGAVTAATANNSSGLKRAPARLHSSQQTGCSTTAAGAVTAAASGASNGATGSCDGRDGGHHNVLVTKCPGQGNPDATAAVTCMSFTPTGQLVVGLASGHVCLLRFRHRK